MKQVEIKEQNTDKRITFNGEKRSKKTVITLGDDDGVLGQFSLNVSQLYRLSDWIQVRLEEIQQN